MNKISINIEYNSYTKHNYFVLKVDDILLEDILFNESNKKGLVPTLLSWLEEGEQRHVVWSRILPNNSKKSICPILMCGECIDFFCDLIVVEILSDENYVYWNRFGFEEGLLDEVEKVGENVKWFKSNNLFKFDKIEYAKTIKTFLNNLNSETPYQRDSILK